MQIHAGITVEMNEFGRKLLFLRRAHFIHLCFFYRCGILFGPVSDGNARKLKNNGLSEPKRTEKMIIIIKCVRELNFVFARSICFSVSSGEERGETVSDEHLSPSKFVGRITDTRV